MVKFACLILHLVVLAVELRVIVIAGCFVGAEMGSFEVPDGEGSTKHARTKPPSRLPHFRLADRKAGYSRRIEDALLCAWAACLGYMTSRNTPRKAAP
jgi:hypothetical protein